MKPYYEDNHITQYQGNVLEVLSEIPKESIQCVVTSPPYWGLRKYSGEQELVWGENHCEHEWLSELRKGQSGGTASKKVQVGGLDNFQIVTDSQQSVCQLCGAWKGSYGLEPTPELYIEHTIEILNEIKRVLRKDGVVFWNIGDSYASRLEGGQTSTRWVDSIRGGINHESTRDNSVHLSRGNLKPKDLCLIPFRVAIAAQEAGWWVRSVIIWSKPNPMPESVTDRPTESHEYILLLTKSAKYYWDADAVREPTLGLNGPKPEGKIETQKTYQPDGRKGYGSFKVAYDNPNGRNIRSVWEFPTQPYPEAHFAVFPEKLPETCIKAGTPEVGSCAKCGKPWERIVEITSEYQAILDRSDRWSQTGDELIRRQRAGHPSQLPQKNNTLGWRASCNCNAGKVPAIVLDPFSGAGTTLWVAKKLNRRAIGIDTSEEYCELAIKRYNQQALGI